MQQQTGQNEKKRSKSIGSVVYNVILVLLIAATGVLFVLRSVRSEAGKPGGIMLFGHMPTVVVSGSMLPTIDIGAVCIIDQCSLDEVQVGDVVVYYEAARGINIVHRVISAGNRAEDGTLYCRTQGDANAVADSTPVTSENLVGRVGSILNWTAPFVSRLITPEHKINYVVFAVIAMVFAAAVCFLWDGVLFAGRTLIRRIRGEKQTPAAQEMQAHLAEGAGVQQEPAGIMQLHTSV